MEIQVLILDMAPWLWVAVLLVPKSVDMVALQINMLVQRNVAFDVCCLKSSRNYFTIKFLLQFQTGLDTLKRIIVMFSDYEKSCHYPTLNHNSYL